MADSVFTAEGDGRRADVILSEAAGISRSRAAALMAEGCCLLGGAPCAKPGLRVPAGQVLTLTVPEPRPAEPLPEDLPLEILYQDPDLAVVVKPRGMVTHPAAGHGSGTLVNALMHHLDSLGGIGGELRPGIVHRLDKDTSGLMIVAKNDESQLALSRMLADREIEKHYRALVEGRMKESSGRIALPLGRSRKDRKKIAVDPDGREAVTECRVLAEGRACALLDVHILRGGTHQIRVHMQSIHHPVCGDPLYGWDRGVPVPCLMLHAYSLRFRHPRSGEELFLTAPLPEDFRRGLRAGGLAAEAEEDESRP